MIFSKTIDKNGNLWIAGIATTNTVDRENESLTITPKAFLKAYERFENKGAPVLVEHGESEKYGVKPVGTVVNMDYSPKRRIDLDSPTPSNMKIQAVCKITDKNAVSDILSRDLEGFSISLLAKSFYKSPGRPYMILTEIEFRELTICKNAMNPDADKFQIIETVDDMIALYGQEARVKSYGKVEGVGFYEVEFEELKIKSMIPESEIDKAYTSSINTRSLDREIRKTLLRKIKDEGYDIPPSEVSEFSYSIPRFTLSFGKDRRYTTEVTLGSDDRIVYHTRISGAEKRKAVEQEKIDEVFRKYHDVVNMSASELEAWSETEASKLASLSRAPINRNLRLLRKKKEDWTAKDINDANRTISFIARMSASEQGDEYKDSGYSKRDISLKNWAFDPRK